jgi:hypothetical protein
LLGVALSAKLKSVILVGSYLWHDWSTISKAEECYTSR